MKKVVVKYRMFMATLIVFILFTLIDPTTGYKGLSITANALKEMMLVIPPIFILLGLLDVWVPKETMVKYMGEKSGVKGILLAFFIGSAAAGPLYGAFPVAAVFMKKGVKFSNIMIFIGAWSTTKIPMFLFELTALGPVFAFSRLLINIPGILLIAYVINTLLSKETITSIYTNAESLTD